MKTTKLLAALKSKANPKTMLGLSIIAAIDNNDPDILIFIRSQAADSSVTMAQAIGMDLTKKILAS